ncbi:HAUS augmin-like complex subunit 4-domain-containing protein [Phlyctochytrium arcticum]|nr:HAUS augmin-like complex subunit 4-domain-containing protein [Phlyctochytrium arcticum]
MNGSISRPTPGVLKFQQVRRECFELRTLYECLSDTIFGLDLDGDGNGGDLLLYQDQLNRLLTAAEIEYDLQDAPVGGFLVAKGLDHSAAAYSSIMREHLAVETAKDQIPGEVFAMLVEDIEKQLRAKCQYLCRNVYGSKSVNHDVKLNSAKTAGLASIVTNRQSRIDKRRKEAQTLQMQLLENLSQYYELWDAMMDNLQKIILQVKSKLEPERHQSFAEYSEAVMNNIHLKLRCFKAEAALAMTQGEQGEDLRRMRASLDNVYADLQKQMLHINENLRSYEDVGKEFNDLVSVYTALMRDITFVADDIKYMSR